MDQATEARRIAQAARYQRFTLTSEKATQREIELFLLNLLGAGVSREHRLSAGDIPDFFLPAFGAVVEVKLKSGNTKMRVFKQLERYAQHDAVKAIVLMTNLAMTLPRDIAGKPAFVCSLGAAWL